MVTIINVFGNQIFNYKYKKNMVEQATPKQENPGSNPGTHNIFLFKNYYLNYKPVYLITRKL